MYGILCPSERISYGSGSIVIAHSSSLHFHMFEHNSVR